MAEAEKPDKGSVPSEYLSFLSAALADGIVIESELKTLKEIETTYKIDEAKRAMALEAIDRTERDFLVAVVNNSRTVQRFGRSDSKIVTGEVDAEEYCRGLIVSPHLQQWWAIDPATSQRTLVPAPGSDTRTSSSLESFYDLIVVGVFDKIVHLFSGDHSRWLAFVTLFLCVWRIWASTMRYNTLFDSNDLSTKFAIYFQMFALLGMGLTVRDAFKFQGSRFFALAFVLSFAPLVILYLWAIFRRKRGSKWAVIILGFLIVTPAVTLLGVYFESEPYGQGYLYWMLFASLLPELSFFIYPYMSLIRSNSQPMNIEHVTERYSIFILVVIGETVASLMSDLPWQSDIIVWEVYVGIAAGLTVSFALKILYFDINEQKEVHPFRRSIYEGLVWSFSHGPLCLTLAASAAGFFGIQDSIVTYAQEELIPKELAIGSFGAFFSRLYDNFVEEFLEALQLSSESLMIKSHENLFCLGLSLSLLLLTVQLLAAKQFTNRLLPPKHRIWARLSAAALISLLPFFFERMGGLLLIIVAAAIMSSLALFETIAMLESKADAEHASIETLREMVKKLQ